MGRSDHFADGAKQKNVMRPVSEMLTTTVPGDERSGSWPRAFSYIESEHVTFHPQYWEAFRNDVKARGVRRPIIVHRKGDKTTVVSGHHRLWAAHKEGVEHVPVYETSDPVEAERKLQYQAGREKDWTKVDWAKVKKAANKGK